MAQLALLYFNVQVGRDCMCQNVLHILYVLNKYTQFWIYVWVYIIYIIYIIYYTLYSIDIDVTRIEYY